ncbi:MAG: helix-turn-helix transcriptional regulator [Bacteroidetes bacterium]|nr:helix-turn-helix transcriptional regulator [Bacteroidota bacterium]
MPHEVIFNTYDVYSTVKSLAKYFKTEVINEHAEHKIVVPPAFGEGFISAIDFRDGLGMLMFSCALKKDLVLRYKCDEFQPLRLIFCVQNDFKHLIKADRLQYQLTNLLGSMVSGSSNNEQLFLLPAEKQVYFYSIEIDRKRYMQKIRHTVNSLPDELKDVFTDTQCSRSFLYQGHYSLTIAQSIQNIKTNDYKGLVRRVYMESQTLEIMAMQIKQYIDDLAPSHKQSVLRKKDMELIIEARHRLLSNIIQPPTIKELALLTGVNENKLKKGFRVLYNTSINKLLQDERLSKAKLLIAEERYPIKEIAKMVGYKHSGHFTSKFRKKFGVSPKDYIKTMGL